MIFDSWGGVLADGAFQRFSLAYTERVLARLRRARRRRRARAVHRLHQGRRPVAGADRRARRRRRRPRLDGEPRHRARAHRRPGGAAGQPRPGGAVRAGRAHPRRGRRRARRSLPLAPDGHVFNLGHGISQHTPPESVGVLVEAVHALRAGRERRRRQARAPPPPARPRPSPADGGSGTAGLTRRVFPLLNGAVFASISGTYPHFQGRPARAAAYLRVSARNPCKSLISLRTLSVLRKWAAPPKARESSLWRVRRLLRTKLSTERGDSF